MHRLSYLIEKNMPSPEIANKIIEISSAYKDKSKLYSILGTVDYYNLDWQSFVATVYFVLFDKGDIDYDDIRAQYDDTVASILLNLNSVNILDRPSFDDAENIRNMLLVMTKDLRVLIILLSSVLYNIENISKITINDKNLFAQSVRDIYAPLSARLGLSMIKTRLEDAVLKYLDPKMYSNLAHEEMLNKAERKEQIDKCIQKIQTVLADMHIDYEIYGREKHLASVYKKIKSKNLTLSQLYDLMAIRIIVNTVEECYGVLGKINQNFDILPQRFKDYIAMPKSNGYQSLHTVVLADNNRPIELQIRTREMHEFCEYGVAAHWVYKEKKKHNAFDDKVNWLRKLIDENSSLTSTEFIANIKSDIFDDEIYAQTPNGKIIKFPNGANCIDFAYAIHTDVGNKCIGAKINDKMVPLYTKLNNGDVCEILVSKTSKGPSRDWLKTVATSSARNKINAYFKRELVDENIKKGKSILEKSAKDRGKSLSNLLTNENTRILLEKYIFNTLEELYASIGAGSISSEQILNRIIVPEKKQKVYTDDKSSELEGILVNKQEDMMTRFAKCCTPIPGDKIVGYVSRGRGVTIHKSDCANINYLSTDRLIDADWDENVKGKYTASLSAYFDIESGAFSNVTKLLEKNKIDILSLSSCPQNQGIEIKIRINVVSSTHLDEIIAKISNLPHLKKVIRAN